MFRREITNDKRFFPIYDKAFPIHIYNHICVSVSIVGTLELRQNVFYILFEAFLLETTLPKRDTKSDRCEHLGPPNIVPTFCLLFILTEPKTCKTHSSAILTKPKTYKSHSSVILTKPHSWAIHNLILAPTGTQYSLIRT